jgi:hypothetical protein
MTKNGIWVVLALAVGAGCGDGSVIAEDAGSDAIAEDARADAGADASGLAGIQVSGRVFSMVTTAALADVDVVVKTPEGETVATLTTDADGRFAGRLPAGEGIAKFEAVDHAAGFKAFDLPDLEGIHVDVFVAPVTANGEIDPSKGGTLTDLRGAALKLPQNAVLKADGSAVTGPVELGMASIVPEDAASLTALPGAGTLQRMDGSEEPVRLEGALHVTMSEGDEPVVLEAGATAVLHVPVVGKRDAPARLELFSLDEASGKWVHEGYAHRVPSTSIARTAYQARVSHLSYWAVGEARETGCIRACALADGPAPGASIRISATDHTFFKDAIAGDDGCAEVSVPRHLELAVHGSTADASSPATVALSVSSVCGPAVELALMPHDSAAASCPSGFVPCHGRCVDLRSDFAHCGACDAACGDGASPVGAACITATCTCTGAGTVCTAGGVTACVSTSTDVRHCGGCNTPCDAGQLCEEGGCRDTVCGDGVTERGERCFDQVSVIDVGVHPREVVAADFNADGIPDLAILSTSAEGQVAPLFGIPGGGYQLGTPIPACTDPKAIRAADLNADGFIDLVVACSSATDALQLLINDGAGGFNAGTPVDTNDAWSIATGDFNADGRVDLAVGSRNSTTLRVFLQQPDGSFGAAITTALGAYAVGVEAHDLNLDGKDDVLLAHAVTEPVTGTILRAFSYNPNENTFFDITDAAPTDLLTDPNGLTVGDVTGNGALDAVVGPNGMSGSVVVFPGTGAGAFGPAFAVPGAVRGALGGARLHSLGDVTGDGQDEIAVFDGSTSETALWQHTGGTELAPLIRTPTGAGPGSVLLTDLTGNGLADQVITNTDTTTVTLVPHEDGGRMGPVAVVGAAPAPAVPIRADLDNDGVDDLLLLHLADGVVSSLLGTLGGLPRQGPAVDLGTPLIDGALGDVDGDGVADLAVLLESELVVRLGDGGGDFAPHTTRTTSLAASHLAVGDLDSDGRADVIVLDGEVGQLSIYSSGPGGTLAAPIDISMPDAVGPVLLEDVDGDGVLDLLVATTGGVTVWLGTGDGSFGDGSPVGLSASPDQLALVDVNANGLADLVTGPVAQIAWGDGAGAFAEAFALDVPTGEALALGDLSLNGLPDLAMLLDGQATVLWGDGLGSFEHTTLRLPAGASPLRIATGDFDGDGFLDMAATNPSTGAVTFLYANP